jgi:hypothetical protein
MNNVILLPPWHSHKHCCCVIIKKKNRKPACRITCTHAHTHIHNAEQCACMCVLLLLLLKIQSRAPLSCNNIACTRHTRTAKKNSDSTVCTRAARCDLLVCMLLQSVFELAASDYRVHTPAHCARQHRDPMPAEDLRQGHA